MKKASVLLAATALAMFGLAACGGDDDDGGSSTTAADTSATTTDAAASGGAASTVDISAAADGSFMFDQADLSTKAGSVTVKFDNPATLSHDVVIEDESGNEVGKTDLISSSSAETTVDLQPGTYTYFCDVPGHREGGMEGTLTVK